METPIDLSNAQTVSESCTFTEAKKEAEKKNVNQLRKQVLEFSKSMARCRETVGQLLRSNDELEKRIEQLERNQGPNHST